MSKTSEFLGFIEKCGSSDRQSVEAFLAKNPFLIGEYYDILTGLVSDNGIHAEEIHDVSLNAIRAKCAESNVYHYLLNIVSTISVPRPY